MENLLLKSFGSRLYRNLNASLRYHFTIRLLSWKHQDIQTWNLEAQPGPVRSRGYLHEACRITLVKNKLENVISKSNPGSTPSSVPMAMHTEKGKQGLPGRWQMPVIGTPLGPRKLLLRVWTLYD